MAIVVRSKFSLEPPFAGPGLPCGDGYFSATGDGRLISLDRGLRVAGETSCPRGVPLRAASPRGRWLAFATDERLVVTRADGSDAVEFRAKSFDASVLWVGLDSVLFSPIEEDVLYVVRHESETAAWLERRRAPTWRIEAHVEFDDPMRRSHTLVAHPEGRVLAIGSFSPDEFAICWAHDDGTSLRIAFDSTVVSDGPPVFHPSGREFATRGPDHVIRRYRLSDRRLLGRYDYDRRTLGEDYGLGDSLDYLSDGELLFQSHGGRLYLLGLDEMRVVDEVQIAGHEPIPSREVHPGLNEDGLISDLESFERLRDDEWISHHARSEWPSHSGRPWFVTHVWAAPERGLSTTQADRERAPHTAEFLERLGW